MTINGNIANDLRIAQGNSKQVAIYNPLVSSEVEFAKRSGKVIRRELTTFPTGVPSYQVRQYAEGPFCNIGDFITMSVDIKDLEGLNKASKVLVHGTEIPGKGKFFPTTGGYYLADGEMTLFGLRTPFVNFYSAAGLKSKVDGSAQQFNRQAKYVKRLMSHHNEGMFFGQTVRHEGTISRVQMHADGEFIQIKTLPCQVGRDGHLLNDGMALITVSALEMATRTVVDGLVQPGIQAKPGDGFSFTALYTQADKGHMVVVSDIAPDGEVWDADMYLFGNRKFLAAVNDHFIFGLLNKLKIRQQLYTDLQSVINYKLTDFIYPWALKQDQNYRTQLETGANQGSYENMVNQSSGLGLEEDPFLPTQIIRMGRQINMPLMPHLVPRAFKREAAKLSRKYEQMALLSNRDGIRIEVPEDQGTALYAMVDISAFDHKGFVHEDRGVLASGACYVDGREGKCFTHRQPNGQGEFKGMSMENPLFYIGFENSPFIFISAASIGEALMILGGGDQDDSLIVYFGSEMVSHFETLTQKVMPQEEKKPAVSPFNRFGSLGSFTTTCFISMLKKKHQETATLGAVINRLMLWAYLKSIGRLGNVYDLSLLNDRLEEVIDMFVKDNANMGWLDIETKAFDVSLAGAELPLWHGRKSSEYTMMKYAKIGVTWFQSPLDVELDKIRGLVDIQPFYISQRMNTIVLGDWSPEGGNHILGTLFREVQVDPSHPAYQLYTQVRSDVTALRHFNKSNLALWLMDGKLNEDDVRDIKNGATINQHPKFGTQLTKFEQSRFEGFSTNPIVIQLMELVMQRDIAFKYQNYRYIDTAWFLYMQNVYGRAIQVDNILDAKDLPDSIFWGKDTIRLTGKALAWANVNLPSQMPNIQEVLDSQDVPTSVLDLTGAIVTDDLTPVSGVVLSDLPAEMPGVMAWTLVNGSWHQGIKLNQMESWKNKLDNQILQIKAGTFKGEPAAKAYLNGNFEAWLSLDDVDAFYAYAGGKTVEGIVSRLPGFKMQVNIC